MTPDPHSETDPRPLPIPSPVPEIAEIAESEPPGLGTPPRDWLASERRRIALAAVAAVAVGFALGGASVGAAYLGAVGAAYGWTLFLVAPAAMGATSATIVHARKTRHKSYAGVTGGLAFGLMLAVWAIATATMLFIQIEGLFCILLASPLYAALYLAGYWSMRTIIRNHRNARSRRLEASIVPVLAAIGLVAVRIPVPAPLRTETTTMEIDAPPERIWPLLFRMDAIPPPLSFPRSLPFRMGVAHPVAIASTGEGVGARRECRLSTGVMPETIEVSEPGRRLRFRVLETPDAMREWNPFGPVRAGHLRGYFTVAWGEFRLEPLPGGRTRLIGTSATRLRLAPALYWDLWGDAVVDGVHVAVMEEIRRRVERAAPLVAIP